VAAELARLTEPKIIPLRFDFVVVVFFAAVVLFVVAYLLGVSHGRHRNAGNPNSVRPSGEHLEPEEEADAPEAPRHTPAPASASLRSAAPLEVAGIGSPARADRPSARAGRHTYYTVEVIRFKRSDEPVAGERARELREAGFGDARYALDGREWVVYAGRFGDLNDRAARKLQDDIRAFERPRVPGRQPYRRAKLVPLKEEP
jgi:hypothetical protein